MPGRRAARDVGVLGRFRFVDAAVHEPVGRSEDEQTRLVAHVGRIGASGVLQPTVGVARGVGGRQGMGGGELLRSV